MELTFRPDLFDDADAIDVSLHDGAHFELGAVQVGGEMLAAEVVRVRDSPGAERPQLLAPFLHQLVVIFHGL